MQHYCQICKGCCFKYNILNIISSKYAALLPNMQRGCGCWTICQVFPPSSLLSLLSYRPIKIQMKSFNKHILINTNGRGYVQYLQLWWDQVVFNIIVSSSQFETFKTCYLVSIYHSKDYQLYLQGQNCRQNFSPHNFYSVKFTPECPICPPKYIICHQHFQIFTKIHNLSTKMDNFSTWLNVSPRMLSAVSAKNIK